MAEGPLIIIANMLAYLLKSSADTAIGMLGMLGNLIGSLFLVAGAGGTLGLILAVGIMGIVGYFIVKFFYGSVKTIMVLLGVLFIIILFLIWGVSSL